MLTIEDVAAVPLFSGLPTGELERLARTSADLHLGPGEFAVPEGGERALFAVLTGKIEVVKTIDGVERRLGFRLPGTIFGEVPIALGTPFPGGYRAVEMSRVMRIDPQEYYAVAAVSHDVSLKVGALARERIGGLQSIAAEPPTPRVIVVGHRWDTACGDLRRFLARNQISLNWVTPDSPELSTVWPGARPADGDLPVLRLADGQVLARPEVRDPRGSRTTSDFPTESRATSWPVVRSSRRDASGQRSWSRAPSLASIRRRAKCFSTVATSSAHEH
jgi:thioredoxin reductase (NADPH)